MQKRWAEVKRELAPIAETRGVELRIESGIRDPRFEGNREAFGAMIRKLVENAIRHSPDGGTVTIGIEHRVLSVSDQGAGMPPELHERALERFVRSQADSPTGSGLGLSIVARVAELHGCRVVIAKPSQGQRFEIRWD